MHAMRCFEDGRTRKIYPQQLKRLVRLVAYILGFLVALYYFLLYVDTLRPLDTTLLEGYGRLNNVTAGQRKLALVLPVDGPSPQLCKVIASAVALGYPHPIIVNWRKHDLYVNADPSIPSHLLKITGVLDLLESAVDGSPSELPRMAEDDLVVVMDAMDVWLQLPPEVLIQRYFAINARANARLAEQYSDCEWAAPEQSIIVSAQKRCVRPHNTVSELHCEDVPQSPLPDDLYGMWTDLRISKAEYRRARYLNSGGFIGPAGDLREYFVRVRDRMEQSLRLHPTAELAGDQGIFAEIWAEQEIWRKEAINELGQPDPAEAKFEYHVGLDYFQELFYPTCGSERSGSFVEIDDEAALRQASTSAGVAPLRLQKVPDDINHAPPPLSSLYDETSWSAKNLFADFWTTAIPVAIHNNAYAHGLKSRQQTWWDKTWYFPHLRRLIELRAASNASVSVAEIDAAEGSLQVQPYKAPDGLEAAFLFAKRMRKLEAANWDEVCQADGMQPWWEEVLRDGRGSI
ncbi:hypothetical protein KC332_g1913 [Hortaea werneckii]|uniref:Uncharacterized protein n=2 Tax=Hortaea werneckii TaxID=91943 RepID=A0A3M7IPE7_HORWE|nr:hypothetical protein KC358_g1859 [Hortaea werneckii]OTA36894.1 hypothetical protein BTJ68_03793 [Hortaea werneckii EXF-2000]KAI6924021.1 hypothetical protein KC341_g14318 [Hortaea werneckii]KAI6948824.1 hypothetical protein KC348_g1717 [Hortaea werneckii]KAI6956395.1 hypothetical protein KC321_g15189 [Hortaea werneckii]